MAEILKKSEFSVWEVLNVLKNVMEKRYSMIIILCMMLEDSLG